MFLGPVNSNELGFTLTHEHFSLNFEKFYVTPPEKLKSYFTEKITLQNVGFIRQYPYGSKYNISFNDTDTHNSILQEAQLFKKFGGGTIVENTSHGLERNIPLMIEVSKSTGIHVVAGTGYYVAAVQPNSTLQLSIEEMSEIMNTELTKNCSGFETVRCGFIGEVGSSWPIQEFERKAICATAEVQSELKCPVSFHPGRNWEAPFKIMRYFLEAGGDPKKTIMSHLDRTILSSETLLEFASLGCYCEQDLFGTECSWYQLETQTDMLSDAQRLDRVVELVQNGFCDKVLLSHDIHTKHRLVNFGGHGFSHIINNVIPKMLIKDMDEETINKITKENPKTWLSWSVK